MRIRFFHIKYALFAFLICVCVWGSRRKHEDNVSKIISEISTYDVTAFRSWFPELKYRIKFGTPETWRDPSVDSNKEEPGYAHVLDSIANETFLALKTGSEVMFDRVPVHLETTFKRFPHHQIYADTESQIGTESVVDVIGMLPESSINDSQLQGYRLRREQQEESWGWSTNDIKQERNDGWDIDKFKNIPMLLHAFSNAPKHCKWFLFIDDDTYIHTQSLGSLLRDLDPEEQHYIGSTAMIFGGIAEAGQVGAKLKKEDPSNSVMLPFAHGGSGIIMSRGTVEALFWDPQRDTHQMNKYAKWAIETCCGDAVMAFMLREELDLTINSGSDPLELEIDPFQGERFENTALSAAAGGWCSRIITWHHLGSWEIQKLFDWETSLQTRKPNSIKGVLYSDFYHDFILPYLEPRRDYWDNMASTIKFLPSDNDNTSQTRKRSNVETHTEDTPQTNDETDEVDPEQSSDDVRYPYRSPESCEIACQADPKCLGWKFEQQKATNSCYIEQEYVRRGVSRHPFHIKSEPDYTVVSGWISDRIRTIRSAEICDPLSYDLHTEQYSDQPHEQEGWYFRELFAEQEGLTDRPVL